MPEGSASAIFEQRLTYLFMSKEQQVKRALATKSLGLALILLMVLTTLGHAQSSGNNLARCFHWSVRKQSKS